MSNRISSERANEDETERRERKRKRKEEKRLLRASQGPALATTQELSKASDHKKSTSKDGQSEGEEKLSKEERRRAKHLKKLLKRRREREEDIEGTRRDAAKGPEVEALKRKESVVKFAEAETWPKALQEQDVTSEKKSKKKKKRKGKVDVESNSESNLTVPSQQVNLPTLEPSSSRSEEQLDAHLQASKEERKRAKELRKKRRQEEKERSGAAESVPLSKNSITEIVIPSKDAERTTTPPRAGTEAASTEASTSKLKALEEAIPSAEEDSEHLSLAAPRNPSATSPVNVHRPTRKRDISAMIDAVLKKKVTGPPSRKGKTKEPDEVDEFSEGMGSSLNTKESVLADAFYLTHKQILVDKLYRSHQLKWLQEEMGLKVKTGAFSSWEQDQMQQAIVKFREEHGMSHDELAGWINANKTDRDNKAMYTEFWKLITASLEDRSNRTVRIFVRRMMLPKNLGIWSKEEVEKLSHAVGEKGPVWAEVAKAVGTRSAEDCRLRWRDYSDEGKKIRKIGGFSKEEEQTMKDMVMKICQEKKIDFRSLSAVIPWKLVAARLGGVRRANTYQAKWQSLQAAGLAEELPDDADLPEKLPETAWTDEDTRILLDRLSKQSRALERDDFTEINLASLRSSDWLAEIAAMRRNWRRLVRQHCASEEYKRNFCSNLAKIKKAFADGSESVGKSTKRCRRSSNDAEGSSKKRGKRSQSNDEEDMIESEEEV